MAGLVKTHEIMPVTRIAVAVPVLQALDMDGGRLSQKVRLGSVTLGVALAKFFQALPASQNVIGGGLSGRPRHPTDADGAGGARRILNDNDLPERFRTRDKQARSP